MLLKDANIGKTIYLTQFQNSSRIERINENKKIWYLKLANDKLEIEFDHSITDSEFILPLKSLISSKISKF